MPQGTVYVHMEGQPFSSYKARSPNALTYDLCISQHNKLPYVLCSSNVVWDHCSDLARQHLNVPEFQGEFHTTADARFPEADISGEQLQDLKTRIHSMVQGFQAQVLALRGLIDHKEIAHRQEWPFAAAVQGCS